MTTPIIKFPGGKGYLVDTILTHFPKKFGTYFEPMVGGGAVFFELAHRGKIKEAWLSDINDNLVNIYEQVRNNLPELITYLRALRKKRSVIVTQQGDAKELYYAVRKRVNKTNNPVEQAAGLIYLSKTCFNGLFRFNQKGKFNAPVGDQKNPKICDETNLTKVSEALQKVNLSACSYEILDRHIKKGDMVYLDPPYWPLRQTSFISYASTKFDKEEHKKLAQYYAKWSARGVKLLLSNACAPEVKQLYKKFDIVTVQAPRRINAHGSGRGLVREFLIKNY